MNPYTPPTADDLQAIAEQVWASYLDLDGSRPLMLFAPPGRSIEVIAWVSVTGAWHGSVVVSCSDPASRHAAAALLGVELADVTLADVVDALGELANIVGGNVKSLLPEPCALSLPHVQVDASGVDRWSAGTEVCQVRGTWLDEPVDVRVLETEPERVGAAQ